MPRRTITAGHTGTSSSEVRGSLFDQPENPVRLPAGLDKRVRATAKRIVEQNGHLDHSHTDAIIRLAKTRVRAEKIEEQLEESGYTQFDEKRKKEVAHPLLAILNQVNASALAQERSLAITFVAKNGQVREAEKQRRGAQGTVIDITPAHGTDDEPRQLRLA